MSQDTIENNVAAEAVQFDHQKQTDMHAPELYTYEGVIQPLANLEAIDDEAVQRFREDGFLAVRQLLSVKEVAAARAAISDFVMGRVGTPKEIQFEWTEPEALAAMSLAERELRVRKLYNFCQYDTALRSLSEKSEMLTVIHRLMGIGENGSVAVDANEPRMFQDMGLIKPPGGREKPWHQDQAYFEYPIETPVVGVWIALGDATAENGCMRFVPGSHRNGPVIHFARRDWQICDEAMLSEDRPPRLVCPLPAGGAVFFSGLIHHGTPYNATDQRRRALQYHYAPDDVVKASLEYRLSHFGSEGKDVQC